MDEKTCEIIIQKILVSSEYRYLKSPLCRQRNTTLIFSLKECLFKAIYPLCELPFDFKDFQVDRISEDGNWCGKLLIDLMPLYKKGDVFIGKWTLCDNKVVTGIEI